MKKKSKKFLKKKINFEILMVKWYHTKNLSKIGDKIFFRFFGVFVIFKSYYAYVNRLSRTELESQTSLTVEIVVSKDV